MEVKGTPLDLSVSGLSMMPSKRPPSMEEQALRRHQMGQHLDLELPDLQNRMTIHLFMTFQSKVVCSSRLNRLRHEENVLISFLHCGRLPKTINLKEEGVVHSCRGLGPVGWNKIPGRVRKGKAAHPMAARKPRGRQEGGSTPTPPPTMIQLPPPPSKPHL